MPWRAMMGGISLSYDVDRVAPPLRVAVAHEASYVFNASGQALELTGLLCLFDANGACAR